MGFTSCGRICLILDHIAYCSMASTSLKRIHSPISVFDDLDISNQYRGGFPGQTMMLRSWAHTQFRIYVDLLQEKIHLSSMMFGPHDTRAKKAVSIVMLSVSRCSDWILHLMPWRRIDQSAGLISDWSSVIPPTQS